MLYEMNNLSDILYISQYGKAYGTVLLKRWLPISIKQKTCL